MIICPSKNSNDSGFSILHWCTKQVNMQRAYKLLRLISNLAKDASLVSPIKILNEKKTGLLHSYPLLSSITISIGFGGLGDYLEQMFENIRNKNDIYINWDTMRTIKFSSAGISVGFICHYW